MTPGRKGTCPASRRYPDGSCQPDRRTRARPVSAGVDHAAETERRCLRLERVVFTILAAAILVLFCLRSACVACQENLQVPDDLPAYGWPI
jgi:hypothetical protein